MKYALLLMIFFFQISFSQEKTLDSIKKLKETYLKRDSVRVKNLIQYTKFTQLHHDNETEKIIDEALSISKETNFTAGISSSYSSFALLYIRKGDFNKALLYAEKAKKIQDSIHDNVGLFVTNTAIANVYRELKKPEKAILILKENFKLLDDKNPKKAALHFNLAKSYQVLEDYSNAEFHFKEAKKIAKVVHFATGVAIANSSIGTLKIQKGEYKKGIEYIEKALDFYIKNKQATNIAHSYLEIGLAYSKLDKVDNAITYNNKAIAIYKKQNMYKDLKTAYLHQSNYLSLKNNYKEAIFYLKEHYKVKDSIFSIENIKSINDLQTKYETKKITLEKEIALEKNEKSKTILYSTLLIFVLVLLSFLFYFKNYKTKKKAELILTKLKATQKQLATEKQYRTAELKALKSQMNPHFIFNALNSIQGLILEQKTNQSYDYIVIFSNLVRNVLNYSNKDFIPIQEELEFLKTYLELEKLRFGDEFTYTIDYVDNKEIEVPSILVQPFIENALLHGLLHKKGNKTLTITFALKNEALSCTIIDNGVGRKKAKIIQERQGKRHQSFALNAISSRLRMLSEKTGHTAKFTTTDLYNYDIPTGTKVVIIMPYKTAFE